jgi:hypothetical protein
VRHGAFIKPAVARVFQAAGLVARCNLTVVSGCVPHLIAKHTVLESPKLWKRSVLHEALASSCIDKEIGSLDMFIIPSVGVDVIEQTNNIQTQQLH